MSKQALAVLTLAIITLSGCATIFNGSRDSIVIEGPRTAELRVNGQYVGTGIATTMIPKKGEVVISAASPGCTTHTLRVTRTFDPVTLLGFFIDGGLFSIFLIDGAGTGAWSKADSKFYKLMPRC